MNFHRPFFQKFSRRFNSQVAFFVPHSFLFAILLSFAVYLLGIFVALQGPFDMVKYWVRVFGMVNVAPGFKDMPSVINGFSDLIIEIWGEEAGRHARSAVGVAELPFGIPVEIEAEVELTN